MTDPRFVEGVTDPDTGDMRLYFLTDHGPEIIEIKDGSGQRKAEMEEPVTEDTPKETTYLVIHEWAVLVGLILTFLSGLVWGFFLAVLLIT